MKKSFRIIFYFLTFFALTGFKTDIDKIDAANYYNYGIPITQIIRGPIYNNNFSIIVQKSSYTLFLKYSGKLIKSYPCVFGGDPINDKRMMGDMCTPEGNFYITDIRDHFIWGHFIEIDYPNMNSWLKHDQAKYYNSIPADADIGGDIGLHGVADGLEYYVEAKNNWTEGCVALKNNDVNELATHLAVGTPVKIVY